VRNFKTCQILFDGNNDDGAFCLLIE